MTDIEESAFGQEIIRRNLEVLLKAKDYYRNEFNSPTADVIEEAIKNCVDALKELTADVVVE